MPAQRQQRIVDGELMSEPHVRGRRIAVLHIYDRVENRGLDPRTVADRLDLDMADVYSALLYYHENPATFASLAEQKRSVQDEEALSKYPHLDDGS